MTRLYSCSLLLLLSMVMLMTQLPFATHAQIVRHGFCRPTPIRVLAGGMVCERQCYTPGGPPFLCRRIPLTTDLRICSGTCCRSGPNCLQLLRT